MIRFKQYLKEFAQQSPSDLVFDVHTGNSSSLKIPISTTMFKRIWPDTIRATVFHATDSLEKLGKLLTAYTKKRIQEPDPDSGDKPMWDELVVNNFKIKKVHISPEFGPDFEDDDDIDGFPFELYQDTADMVDYINRTVANIRL